jgi:hypothetical protein
MRLAGVAKGLPLRSPPLEVESLIATVWLAGQVLDILFLVSSTTSGG